MLHLNKKGFAISTVLYGILSVVIILLMSIFVMIRTSKTMNDNFAKDVVKKLNTCVADEVALEACYITGSTTCDKTAYYSCIGIEDQIKTPQNYPTIKAKLVPTSGTLATGLYVDSTASDRYIYKGTAVNNYVKFDSQLWRIVAIEPDNTVKIMLASSATTIPWDSDSKIEWSSATINNYLNMTFYSSISDTNKLIRRPINIGTIYDTGTMTKNEIIEQENRVQYTPAENEGHVTLISAADYLKATTDASCTANAFNNNNCKSWIYLNNGSSGVWAINSAIDPNNTSLKLATYINASGALSKIATTTGNRMYPVVYLNPDVKISTGSGTEGSPYVLN